MKVLSCLAANQPDVLVGTAPEASYWLLRSEDDDTEQPVEEDYWAAALEFADSVGVDVVNTSLGYYEFDDKTCNYRYRDLDGHYSLMSHSASMAADSGVQCRQFRSRYLEEADSSGRCGECHYCGCHG